MRIKMLINLKKIKFIKKIKKLYVYNLLLNYQQFMEQGFFNQVKFTMIFIIIIQRV